LKQCHHKTGDPKSNERMIIYKKWGRQYGGAVLWQFVDVRARLQYDFIEASLTQDKPGSAAASALVVVNRHLHALNGLRENDLAVTLHFPHFRLVGATLDYWPPLLRLICQISGQELALIGQEPHGKQLMFRVKALIRFI
jgi:hypothetical protein